MRTESLAESEAQSRTINHINKIREDEERERKLEKYISIELVYVNISAARESF